MQYACGTATALIHSLCWNYTVALIQAFTLLQSCYCTHPSSVALIHHSAHSTWARAGKGRCARVRARCHMLALSRVHTVTRLSFWVFRAPTAAQRCLTVRAAQGCLDLNAALKDIVQDGAAWRERCCDEVHDLVTFLLHTALSEAYPFTVMQNARGWGWGDLRQLQLVELLDLQLKKMAPNGVLQVTWIGVVLIKVWCKVLCHMWGWRAQQLHFQNTTFCPWLSVLIFNCPDVTAMIEFPPPPPILEHFCLFLVQIAQKGLILPRWVSFYPEYPPQGPNPCSLLSHHTFLSGICTYTKHPQLHPKTLLFLAWTWMWAKGTTVWAKWDPNWAIFSKSG